MSSSEVHGKIFSTFIALLEFYILFKALVLGHCPIPIFIFYLHATESKMGWPGSDRVIQPSVAVKARHTSQGHQVQGGNFTDKKKKVTAKSD